MRRALLALLALVPAAGAGAGGSAVPPIVFGADRFPTLYGEIYRVDLTGRRVDLSRSPARDVAPAVSPDGRRVAFASDRGGHAALYVVATRGSRPRPVSPSLFAVGSSDGLIATVAWAPDSRRVAMFASGSSAPPVLYVGSPGGGGRVVRRGTFIDGPAWSPDGRLLVFTTGFEDSATGNEARVVDASGATVWRVAGRPVRHPAWSRGGRLALGFGYRTIRVFDERGRRLASFPGLGFAWSPTGDRLASMNGVRLEIRQGGMGRPVLSVPLLAPSQVFQPDAQNAVMWFSSTRVGVATDEGWIVLDLASRRTSRLASTQVRTTSRDGRSTVWQADDRDGVALKVAALGARPRALVQVPRCAWGPPFGDVQFTPDGRSILYQSNCMEPPADLYAVAPDGTAVRQLTHTDAHETEPSWSPDGRSIAYAQWQAAGLACKGCPETIWALDPATGRRRQLTGPVNGGFDDSPTWSPDGREIVFSRSSATRFGELYVVPAAGGAARSLHVVGQRPAWGPERIAYVDVNRGSIWTMAPDGSDRRQVATQTAPLCLAWSRDGVLAYVDQTPAGAYVHVVGSRPRSFPLPRWLRPSSLAWSPDDKRLVLSSAPAATGARELYAIGTDGSHVRRVTSMLGAAWGVSWRGR